MPIPEKRPKNPGRRKGDHTRLIVVTYKTIADLAGLSVRSVQDYSQRGQYDSRDLESVLQWVNARHAAAGEPLFGIPTKQETTE